MHDLAGRGASARKQEVWQGRLDKLEVLFLSFFLLSCWYNSFFFQELVSLMIEKLKGDDIVLQNIRKSGKEDLYAELLYFLRFGSLR